MGLGCSRVGVVTPEAASRQRRRKARPRPCPSSTQRLPFFAAGFAFDAPLEAAFFAGDLAPAFTAPAFALAALGFGVVAEASPPFDGNFAESEGGASTATPARRAVDKYKS